MQDQTSPFLVTQIAPFSPLLLPCLPLCPSCLLSSSAFPPSHACSLQSSAEPVCSSSPDSKCCGHNPDSHPSAHIQVDPLLLLQVGEWSSSLSPSSSRLFSLLLETDFYEEEEKSQEKKKKIPTLRNMFSLLCQPSHISIWIDCLLQPVSF